MINRTKSWTGWTFPGGHLEIGESITSCIIREMFEETGAVLINPIFKGFVNIFNTETFKRHIIYNYVCNDFSGTIKSECDEGEIRWIDISNIKMLSLSEGMEYRIPLFFCNKIQELYIEWNEKNGYTKINYCEM